MPLERLFDATGSTIPPESLYTELGLGTPPEDRPYSYINMVSTADGKILQGPLGSTAKGLGSPTDQLLMRRLQGSAEGAIIGAGTLRPGNVVYAPHMWRAVVTRSGNLPLENRFFTDAPDKAIVFAPQSLPEGARQRLEGRAAIEQVGGDAGDLRAALEILRRKYGVRSLVIEGGADLNFELFAAGLVDEFFLTVAPKVKGGAHLPTPVSGPGFPDGRVAPLQLRSVYRDGDELYLRYRVART